MKILFFNEYSTARAVSGAEYSTQELAKALKVKIYSPPWKKNKPGKALTPLWFNNPIYWIWAAYHITCAVRSKKIDLIHVHGKYIQSGAVIAGWLTGKPVVTTVRDFKFLCPLALCFTHGRKHCNWEYYLTKEISEYQDRYGRVSAIKLVIAKLLQLRMKWWLNRSAKVVAVSPQLKKIYEDNGVRNLTSIYNLPPVRLAPLAHRYSPKNRKTLLSVGKLSYGKGTDSLIEAMRKLPQVKLILAGELNPSLKVDFPGNVEYLGKISHEQVLKLYGKADAFAILSRWPEPLSRAGLEALAASLPIITSDRGGNQELITDNGIIVDPDDVDGVRAGIKKLLSSDLNRFSQNSLKLYQTRFSRTKIIDQHLKLYQDLI